VLQKYAHVFHYEEITDFKSTDVIEHQILLEDNKPIRRPQYKTPFALMDEMKAQVENMLTKGVIRESSSPLSAPAILVPKRVLIENQNTGFALIFERLTLLPSSTFTHYQGLNKLRLFYTVLSIFQS
jgi:hypothetical protein